MIVRRSRRSLSAHQRLIVRRDSRPPGGGPPPGTGADWLRRFLLVTIAASLVIAVGGGAVWAWNAGAFEVTDVEVRGNGRIPSSTIAELADLDGVRLLTADLGAAEQRVKRHPLVRDASLERRWPNGVLVRVEERTPWGVWEQAGVLYTIDRDGYVLGSFRPDLDLPLIRSTSDAPLDLGERVDYQAVQASADIYALLPEMLGVDVREVAYVQGAGVQVTTEDGRVALLGDSSSIAYKLEAWGALAREARQRNIDYGLIDLRFGQRPILRPGDAE